MNVCRKTIAYSLSKKNLLERLNQYGFVECGYLMAFLNYVCDEKPDLAAYRYIYSKVCECLKTHAADPYKYNLAGEGDYFKELRNLREEIEFIISVN
jgi:hypothetical protein